MICGFTPVREPPAPVNAHDDVGDREYVPLFNLEVEPVSADTIEYQLQALPADVHRGHDVLIGDMSVRAVINLEPQHRLEEREAQRLLDAVVLDEGMEGRLHYVSSHLFP